MVNKVIRQSLLVSLAIMYMPSALSETSVGESIYINNCIVCHAEDGSGAMPGVADLTLNKKWAVLPEQQLIARLKKGINKAGSVVAMPPKGGNLELTDSDLQAVIIYMRNMFSK